MIALDPPRRLGPLHAAALVRRRVLTLPGGTGALASKHPLAVLIGTADNVAAFSASGRPMGMDDLDRLAPNARAEFAEMLRSDGPQTKGQAPSRGT